MEDKYIVLIVGAIAVLALIFIAGTANWRAGDMPWQNGSYPGRQGYNGLGTITVTASGSAYGSPSQATLSVTINATGATNAQAVANLSSSLDSFNSTIYRYVNGNLSMISTEYFNVYKIYNRSGYQATEQVSATIPNISNVSHAIGALSSIPNVYVTYAGAQLSASQIVSLRDIALSNAVSNATRQAQAVAGSSSTLYVSNITVDSYYFYPVQLGTAVGAPASSSVSPQFYSGRSHVTESVTAVFRYSQ